MHSIKSVINYFTGVKAKSSVSVVCHRFLQLFQDHGIEASQIPRLFPRIQLADLHSEERLIQLLSPQVLDEVAAFFGVRVQWLEGVDNRIYEFLCCDKHPETLLEHLSALVKGKEIRLTFPLRILCTRKQLDRNSSDLQLLAPVLVEKIAELGEETICRYHIYQDGFDWGDKLCRLELKAIARIVFKRLRAPISIFEISANEMEALLEGRLIPKRCFRGALISYPSLEDFALSPGESGVAKEVDELPEVLRHIENGELKDFSFNHPSLENNRVEAGPEPEPPITTTKDEVKPLIGKRAQARATVWGPIKIAAQTIWAQEPDLSIADVVRRLQGMPQFRASSRGESAVRKHIASLAPEGVAGKPGRKRNKSA